MNIFDVFKGECGFSVGVDGETERMCRHFKARWGKKNEQCSGTNEGL